MGTLGGKGLIENIPGPTASWFYRVYPGSGIVFVLNIYEFYYFTCAAAFKDSSVVPVLQADLPDRR